MLQTATLDQSVSYQMTAASRCRVDRDRRSGSIRTPAVESAVEAGLLALKVSQRSEAHFHIQYVIPTTQNVFEAGFPD
jgi:hypothetical protein